MMAATMMMKKINDDGDILGFWTEEEAAHVPHERAKQGVDGNLVEHKL